ncbi:hypothetical protein L2E82_17122 [Cichorium intybus]|uniref:Uncharacterized protein n=1 Tax=Cichorium intybus TaxID=13427 RepID=A0ACB9F826_CICIN|nr:hypothetical protein L2E82_17122 [Cichorium intybus]
MLMDVLVAGTDTSAATVRRNPRKLWEFSGTGVTERILQQTSRPGSGKWNATNGSCFEERFEMGKGDWPWRLMAFQKLNFNSDDTLNCVKESNIIIMGATTVVYKADIQRTNTIVAVKKLWSSTNDIELGSSAADFVGKVNVLGKIRHRNIVRLLGFLHRQIVGFHMTNGSKRSVTRTSKVVGGLGFTDIILLSELLRGWLISPEQLEA